MTTVTVDASGVPADLVAVDALARLALAARRRGVTLQLSGASAGLLELLALAGLEELLPRNPGARAARTAGTASSSTGRT
ncbi:MAG: hypothetical protein JWM71_1289 [Solirubrobacteraceae bacterium]|nr:hypothetical protein [Solirubrobacteraceae bacterium]